MFLLLVYLDCHICFVRESKENVNKVKMQAYDDSNQIFS